MIKLGMVGNVLIHNYPYGAYFNGADDEQLEARCTKAWMLRLVRGRHPEPAAQKARITHVWAGVREEAEAIAASCRIGHVCEGVDEVIENVDGVLILDEDIPFRTETIERCLNAGKSVFADKILSPSVDKTRELVDRAREKGVQIAAGSQVLYAVEAEPFRSMNGGAGLVTYNLARDILDTYGIHLVCTAFAAFGLDPVQMTRANTGSDSPPAIMLTYADDKNVLVRSGQDLPPQGNIAYFGKEQGSLTAQLSDMGAMFDRSAEALARMFEHDEAPIPPEAIVRMTEAVALLSE